MNNSGAAHSSASFDRYLTLLGVRRAEPGWDALRELSSRHLMRIPFENVSKIYRVKCEGKRSIPPLDEYLDGIERHNFGGTCYTNNFYMHLLLTHLGYDVALCAADISVNGAPPNGHMVNVVTLDSSRAVVDVGYGAPFWHPLPLGGKTDFVQSLGNEAFILKPPHAEGRVRLEVYRDSELVHGYVLKTEARDVDDFQEVIARSYSDDAPFLNRLMFARFYDDKALLLRNNRLTQLTRREAHHEAFSSRHEIETILVERFRIPIDVVLIVMDSLGDMGGLLH